MAGVARPKGGLVRQWLGLSRVGPSARKSLASDVGPENCEAVFFSHTTHGSLRPKARHTQLKLFRPSTNPPSTIVGLSPTAYTRANNHGGWKVSIHEETLYTTRQLIITSGTRDSPRARRASRRRPWTPSPARTGTRSRYDIPLCPRRPVSLC